MSDADFDALATQARMAQNKTGEQALWQAAVRLPKWYFIAHGTGADMQPLAGMCDNRPTLLAFTDETRAKAWARIRGEKSGQPAADTIYMDVPDAIEYVSALAEDDQIAGVMFNDGEFAFHDTPLSIIQAFKQR